MSSYSSTVSLNTKKHVEANRSSSVQVYGSTPDSGSEKEDISFVRRGVGLATPRCLYFVSFAEGAFAYREFVERKGAFLGKGHPSSFGVVV